MIFWTYFWPPLCAIVICGGGAYISHLLLIAEEKKYQRGDEAAWIRRTFEKAACIRAARDKVQANRPD